MDNKVNFGFKKVERTEKQDLVGNIFSSIAQKYDLMNDVMSLGIHRLWKAKLIDHLQPDKDLIDMASGTGDIAKGYYLKCNNPNIVLCDINQDMLDVGKNKLFDQGIYKGLQFKCCNAEDLPFDDFSFDYYTIAFGIRNVTNIQQALNEAHRVIRPGGKFICLEFSKVENEILSNLYDCYSMNIIPKMGSIIVGDSDSYKYLVESIRMFPSQIEFIKMMEISGFKMCKYETLSLGVASLYTGYRV